MLIFFIFIDIIVLLLYNGYMETKYQAFFFDLRGKLLCGIITREEAEKLSEPIIVEMNEKAKAIAKKYKKSPMKFTYSRIMR